MTNLHDIATVTAAYLRHNRIAAGEVSALISQIARTYQGLDGIPEAVAEKPQPVVSIRSSVKPDALTCLECGRTLKTLRKHIRDHGLEPDSYRERFGLAASYPMVAPAYAAQRSAHGEAIWVRTQPRRRQINTAIRAGIRPRTGTCTRARQIPSLGSDQFQATYPIYPSSRRERPPLRCSRTILTSAKIPTMPNRQRRRRSPSG